jgi:hypothetical protein
VRVACLALFLLALRFILRVPLIPTLFLTFTARWFVLSPLPRTPSSK